MNYHLVLSDELLKLYFDFKNSKDVNADLLTKLLRYHAPFITSVKQLQKIGYDADSAYMTQLLAQELISDNLEELAEKTIYKIILNTENSTYPYVNINGDVLEKNFNLSFKSMEKREKAQDLIRALCSNSKNILIYDKYIKDNWNNSKKFFELLLPKRKLTILYFDNQIKQEQKSELKKICGNWTIKKDTENRLKSCHDRYLLIDNNIEILLSSGFDYLFDESKDFTCLIRDLKI